MLMCYRQGEGSMFLSWRLTGAFKGSQGFAGKLSSLADAWGLEEVPKRERQELISVKKREGKAKVPGMEEAACTPSKDLACLCSYRSQGPAAF